VRASLSKTATFALIHFVVAFSVGYLMTGNVLIGGAIALVEPLVNTVAYFLHELAWRQERGEASLPTAISPINIGGTKSWTSTLA